MSMMRECLNNCALQCWAIENTASIDRQQTALAQTAEDQASERNIIEGYYTEVIDEATAAGDDPDVVALAQSYARFDRGQQEREDSIQDERDQRQSVLENIILANGDLALKTCTGNLDGLCTGEVQREHLPMLRSYLYRGNER